MTLYKYTSWKRKVKQKFGEMIQNLHFFRSVTFVMANACPFVLHRALFPMRTRPGLASGTRSGNGQRGDAAEEFETKFSGRNKKSRGSYADPRLSGQNISALIFLPDTPEETSEESRCCERRQFRRQLPLRRQSWSCRRSSAESPSCGYSCHPVSRCGLSAY